MPHRPLRLALLLAFVASAPSPVASGSTAPRPNVLFILADDLGWGDVGYHGSRALTPTIDRLASEGLELRQHYVTPQCTPTRVALMTGRYPSRFDALVATNAPAFPADTLTLARAFEKAGYQTFLSGKWHLGFDPGHRPWEMGFDHSYGSLSGATHPWQHTYRKGELERTWHRDGERLDEPGWSATELVTREAERFVRLPHDRPWFLYVAHFAVHTPVDAPGRYKRLYPARLADDPEIDDDMRRYLAFTSQLDDGVARLVDALAETGQLDDTLIVFTSDNGALGFWPEGGQGEAYGEPLITSKWAGSSGGLRGRKATTYEGGIRTPAWVYWKGRLEGRRVDHPIHMVDWFPTLTRLAGYTPSGDEKWDGRDVWPLLEGKAPNGPRTFYWKYGGGMGALREGDLKLVVMGDTDWARTMMPGADRSDQLFDLALDPRETTNLAAQRPETVVRLRALMSEMALGDEVGRIFKEGDESYWTP
ncbi:MAG: arylsulfatase [Acidobacteria bacterium]|jgi:arylsulfatase A-like enzyme|nr:arylsulfatase [Acidobacteriota bacterium]